MSSSSPKSPKFPTSPTSPKSPMSFGKTIRSLIQKHTDKDGIFSNILEHFQMIQTFPCGSQGFAGLLLHNETKEKVVFKIPKTPGFEVRHENAIMDKLLGSRKFIPHYSECYGLIRTFVSFDEKNPFYVSKDQAMILTDVLLSEYIPGSITFTEKIKSYSPKIIYSLVQQVLLAIEVGRRKYGLVHYDLHTDNILLRKCPKDSLFLYNFGNQQLLVPTYGVHPVFIDFGFSYLKGQENMYLYSQMGSTDAGYLSCLFDPYYDARVFLMNVSSELAQLKTRQETQFREKILAMYNHLQIDKVKGWDIQKGQYAAADMIVYTIEDMERDEPMSKLFVNEGSKCVHILQALISLPLKNNKNGNFRPHYKVFIQEFSKFEKSVRTTANKILLLVHLVESAQKCRKNDETHDERVRMFRRDFSYYIDKSLSFYNPPEDVDYSALLDSMYQMADCIETVYFRVMRNLAASKKEQYKVPLTNMQIFETVENFYSSMSSYRLYPSSTVFLWDIEREESMKITDFSEKFCRRFNTSETTREKTNMMWKKYIDRSSGGGSRSSW